MTPDKTGEVLGEGRFLRLVRRNGWEWVERTRPIRAAFIGAVTPEGALLVTQEYRVPVQATVIGCPAGLIGDTKGQESESTEDGVRRELVEETGYTAEKVSVLSAGPTSPGQCDEVIALVLAEGLTRVGAGGGISGEQIAVVEVPLTEIDGWLKAREQEGALIDPKVYSILYFLRHRA